jgi:hypothetical protein
MTSLPIGLPVAAQPRLQHRRLHPLQAQPLPLVQVLFLAMQLSPQALPALHVLQQAAA